MGYEKRNEGAGAAGETRVLSISFLFLLCLLVFGNAYPCVALSGVEVRVLVKSRCDWMVRKVVGLQVYCENCRLGR
jgi:hypothetical protein